VRKWLINDGASFSRTSCSAQALVCLGWRLSSGFPEYGEDYAMDK